MEFLNSALRSAVGQDATYVRGNHRFDCDAVLGGSAAELTSPENGATIQTRLRDVLLESAQFDFNAFIEPRSGDNIIVGSLNFVVTNRTGSGCWRFSDSSNTRLRIFVREASL